VGWDGDPATLVEIPAKELSVSFVNRPRGGGRIGVFIEPCPQLNSIELNARGTMRAKSAEAILAGLPLHMAERELKVIGKELAWEEACLNVRHEPGAYGPGDVLLVTLAYENVTEVFAGFGERGRPAEAVAKEPVTEVKRYLKSKAVVGEHLADQLLLPLALAGCGSVITLTPSSHTRTNMAVIENLCRSGLIVAKSSRICGASL